jgi:hypothetical protein
MFTFEIWSNVDNRYNPSIKRYKSFKRAEKALNQYVADVADEGWNTHGNVIELAIIDNALRQVK